MGIDRGNNPDYIPRLRLFQAVILFSELFILKTLLSAVYQITAQSYNNLHILQMAVELAARSA